MTINSIFRANSWRKGKNESPQNASTKGTSSLQNVADEKREEGQKQKLPRRRFELTRKKKGTTNLVPSLEESHSLGDKRIRPKESWGKSINAGLREKKRKSFLSFRKK